MIFHDDSMFCCDVICIQDPIDTILTGFPGKTMMGTARRVVKGVMKSDARNFPGVGFIDKYFVVRRIKGCIEIAHENGRHRIRALNQTFQDASGAERLDGGRKIKMGVDTGYLA